MLRSNKAKEEELKQLQDKNKNPDHHKVPPFRGDMTETQLERERTRFLLDLSKIAPNKTKFMDKMTADFDQVTML